jgi:hypothetical protein
MILFLSKIIKSNKVLNMFPGQRIFRTLNLSPFFTLLFTVFRWNVPVVAVVVVVVVVVVAAVVVDRVWNVSNFCLENKLSC